VTGKLAPVATGINFQPLPTVRIYLVTVILLTVLLLL